MPVMDGARHQLQLCGYISPRVQVRERKKNNNMEQRYKLAYK